MVCLRDLFELFIISIIGVHKIAHRSTPEQFLLSRLAVSFLENFTQFIFGGSMMVDNNLSHIFCPVSMCIKKTLTNKTRTTERMACKCIWVSKYWEFANVVCKSGSNHHRHVYFFVAGRGLSHNFNCDPRNVAGMLY